MILSIETAEIPKVQPAFRLKREAIGAGIEQARLKYGFMDEPDVPAELRFALDDPDQATYVLGAEAIQVTPEEGMAQWREHLYALMHRNATAASTYFHLPTDRTFSIGTHIEL